VHSIRKPVGAAGRSGGSRAAHRHPERQERSGIALVETDGERGGLEANPVGTPRVVALAARERSRGVKRAVARSVPEAGGLRLAGRYPGWREQGGKPTNVLPRGGGRRRAVGLANRPGRGGG